MARLVAPASESASRFRARTPRALATGAVRCAQCAACGLALFLAGFVAHFVLKPDSTQDSLWLLLMGLVLWGTLISCAGGTCLGTLSLLRPRQSRFAVALGTAFCVSCGVFLNFLMFHDVWFRG